MIENVFVSSNNKWLKIKVIHDVATEKVKEVTVLLLLSEVKTIEFHESYINIYRKDSREYRIPYKKKTRDDMEKMFERFINSSFRIMDCTHDW